MSWGLWWCSDDAAHRMVERCLPHALKYTSPTTDRSVVTSALIERPFAG